MITNANIDRWRRSRGGERPSPGAGGGSGASTDLAGGVAERDAVLRALAGLSAQERKVVVLRFLEDFSEADPRSPGDPARDGQERDPPGDRQAAREPAPGPESGGDP